MDGLAAVGGGHADGLLGYAEALEDVVLALVVVPELTAVVEGLVAQAELDLLPDGQWRRAQLEGELVREAVVSAARRDIFGLQVGRTDPLVGGVAHRDLLVHAEVLDTDGAAHGAPGGGDSIDILVTSQHLSQIMLEVLRRV